MIKIGFCFRPQVVTIATYAFFLAGVIGRKYVEHSPIPYRVKPDLYIPYFTLLQFFFYMGLLKVTRIIRKPAFLLIFFFIASVHLVSNMIFKYLKKILCKWTNIQNFIHLQISSGSRTTHKSIRWWRWGLRTELDHRSAHEG